MTPQEKYIYCKQKFAEVSKGGKDYSVCSYGDILQAETRFNEAKQDLISYFGKIELENFEKKLEEK
jgi:hypothetical protein